ncbi:DNRLRE domain-containing protein, partial [Escherichia coli]|uniref:DNRLRE domain-containing protein n=1 Tax=Escherichia coli TaxID=562 RepID=UPI0028DDCCD7
MDTLPKLPAGSVITGADLILFNYYSYSAEKSMTVDIRRATADWSAKTATWNNSNSIYENEVQDYYVVPENEWPDNQYDTWEITRLVKGWYEGTIPNYGVMLTSFAAENASPAHCTKYLSSNSL